MEKVRSFFNIWTVPKFIYSFGDLSLPFPLRSGAVLWSVISASVIIVLGGHPFLFIDSFFIRHLGIPVLIGYVMSRPMFEGRRPDRFVLATFSYLFRSKQTYAGMPVTLGSHKANQKITAVRRVNANAKSKKSKSDKLRRTKSRPNRGR